MSSLNVTDLTGSAGGGLWREIRVVAETGSTNADLVAAARAGEPEGLVLVAEAQRAARGRLGRRWESPPGAGLTFSVLLRPAGVPPSSLGWLPLLAGVAVAVGVAAASGVQARLKWPNDVLVGERKLAGILAEGWGGAIVIGAGINVTQQRGDLPTETATSLLLEGGPVGEPTFRERLLAQVLAAFSHWYLAWRDQPSPGDAQACGLRAEYLRRSATVHHDVSVLLPGERLLTGQATDVDLAGSLELLTIGGPVKVSAGDVVHVRPVAEE
jgi:BirA family biotin operon repressor/biotin-[acetyl-CoA-carboxylase] ligase